MINMSCPNPRSNVFGAATLIITVMLMTVAVAGMIFAANYSLLQQKTSANQVVDNQAFTAAEAGLEFGLVYLTQNYSTIAATASGGFINYGASNTSLANVVLSNNSKFSVVYTNPTANNYQLILITSTGTSADGTAVSVLKQLAQSVPGLGTATAFAVGNVTAVGGTLLTNLITNVNIQSGGTVTMNNGALTAASSGVSSTQGNYESDVQQNVSSLQGISESAFFTSIFNTTEAAEKSAIQAAGNYYTNVAGNDYSALLKNKAGVAIWIDQTNGSPATIGQGIILGTALNPIVLIVEGDLTIANGAIINGFVYASAPSNGFDLAGGAIITGGIASAGAINMSNGLIINYSSFPSLPLPIGSKVFYKVPGSWRDF